MEQRPYSILTLHLAEEAPQEGFVSMQSHSPPQCLEAPHSQLSSATTVMHEAANLH